MTPAILIAWLCLLAWLGGRPDLFMPKEDR